MHLYKRVEMKNTLIIQSEEEGGGDMLMAHQSGSQSGILDHDEKRMRRQIANSNERRRMQSINAGFQSLRNLLPHHEGEKLSKAAILQQTAEYIYNLEQEKTRLLSQNCQLKRLLDSQDGDNTVPNQPATQQQTAGAFKKRKLDALALVQTLTDSSDEGLGSMSPEPVSLIQMSTTNGKTTTITTSAVSAKDYLELKHQYDLERRSKAQLEEKLRQYELHTTTHTTIERLREVPIQYQHQEVIEHTDNIRDDDIIIEDPLAMSKGQITIQTADGGIESLQVLSLDSIPSVGETQVVVCTSSDMEEEMEDCTMGPAEIIVTNEPQQKQQHQQQHHQQIKVKDERNIRPNTPKQASQQHQQIQQQQIQQQQQQPQSQKQRIPSILEAAIKAEPKVEVERIDETPAVSIIVKEDGSGGAATRTASQSRMYLTNTSRQNLETIVEAIRHLEGDHLFGDMVEQEVPLALTKTATVTTTPKSQQQIHQQQPQQQQQQQQQIIVKSQAEREREREHRQIQLEINPFLKFKTPTATNTVVAATKTQQLQHATAIQQTAATIVQSATSQQQQKTTQNQSNRVGVIVVKQSS